MRTLWRYTNLQQRLFNQSFTLHGKLPFKCVQSVQLIMGIQAEQGYLISVGHSNRVCKGSRIYIERNILTGIKGKNWKRQCVAHQFRCYGKNWNNLLLIIKYLFLNKIRIQRVARVHLKYSSVVMEFSAFGCGYSFHWCGLTMQWRSCLILMLMQLICICSLHMWHMHRQNVYLATAVWELRKTIILRGPISDQMYETSH